MYNLKLVCDITICENSILLGNVSGAPDNLPEGWGLLLVGLKQAEFHLCPRCVEVIKLGGMR